MPIEPLIWSRPLENAELNCEEWLAIIKAVNVKYADTTSVRERFHFIIWTPIKSHLVYLIKDLPDLGKKSKKKLRNAFSFARIVTWKFTKAYRSFPFERRVEKRGEFGEALRGNSEPSPILKIGKV